MDAKIWTVFDVQRMGSQKKLTPALAKQAAASLADSYRRVLPGGDLVSLSAIRNCIADLGRDYATGIAAPEAPPGPETSVTNYNSVGELNAEVERLRRENDSLRRDNGRLTGEVNALGNKIEQLEASLKTKAA